MDDPVTITLAKALRCRKRLAGELDQARSQIAAYNSLPAGAERIDVRTLFVRQREMVEQLVALKHGISQANNDNGGVVLDLILRQGEAKAELTWLASVPTRHGQYSEYGDGQIDYVSEMRKAELDRRRVELTREVDDLQDRIDAYNARTTMVVDRRVVDGWEALGAE